VSPLFVESVQKVGFVIVALNTLSGTILASHFFTRQQPTTQI
jgi:hypothetical protein